MGARESGGKVRQWKVRRDLPHCKALYIPGGFLAGFLNHQTVSVQPVSPAVGRRSSSLNLPSTMRDRWNSPKTHPNRSVFHVPDG